MVPQRPAVAKLEANQPTMELSMTGVVGRVVQEHEDMRHRSLEKLARSRKLATKAVEKASLLLQPKATQKAEEVAKGQTQVDRVTRCLKEETRELEELVEDWSSAYGDLSKELVLIGDLKDWAETIELQLRSVKAELEHSKGCMVSWQRMKDQERG